MFYLVAYCLGTAPFQKNLFDAAGTGHPKTLRPLQFGFWVHRFGPTIYEQGQKGHMREFQCRTNSHLDAASHCIYLLPASESSLSKMDRRAWAPMLRGRVCDLTSSRLLSPTCPKDLSLLASPFLQKRIRIKHCNTYLTSSKQYLRSLTCHAAVAPSRSQIWQGRN